MVLTFEFLTPTSHTHTIAMWNCCILAFAPSWHLSHLGFHAIFHEMLGAFIYDYSSVPYILLYFFTLANVLRKVLMIYSACTTSSFSFPQANPLHEKAIKYKNMEK